MRLRSRHLGALIFPIAALASLAFVITLASCDKGKDSAETDAEQSPENDEATVAQRSGDSAMRYVGGSDERFQQAAGAQSRQAAFKIIEQAPRPDVVVTMEEGCVRPECHAALSTTRHVHGPLAAGDCESCHAEDTGGHVFPLKRDDVTMCTFCHQMGGRHERRHAALDTGGCRSCHLPHGSEMRYLLAADSVESLCRHCHPADDQPIEHGPYAAGECTACHDPHSSSKVSLLRGRSDSPGVNDHCALCHTETAYAMANAPHVHAPAAADCTSCHAAHGSSHSRHLKAEIDTLCLSCHADVEETISGAVSAHAAVFTADKCANCHDAHASGRPSLLRGRQTELCLECHGKDIITEGGRLIPDMTESVLNREFLHGPVAAGECSECHSVHGASHANLLQQYFPPTFYADYALENYALCFSCHESDLVQSERTETLTDFRDGDINLHYLHVNRDTKGRSCKGCHAIHGSSLPKHIATKVPFGQWRMSLGFVQNESGGTCAPGCHEPLTYNRQKNPPTDSEGR